MNKVERLLVGRVNQLLNVERWAPFFKNQKETVWGHTSQLLFIVWWLLWEAYQGPPPFSEDQPLEKEDWVFLFHLLVFHDAEEIYGDVPANFKQLLETSHLDEQGKKAFFQELGMEPPSLSFSPPHTEVLSFLVKVADILCTASFILRELQMGNRHFIRMADEMLNGEVKGLDSLIQKAKSIRLRAGEKFHRLCDVIVETLTETKRLLYQYKKRLE